ncbi:MAG: T9SS type A sorting domain-containing protein [Bacteroidota bacterium]|nr:T9SS type A sorting domain-containing protein [Bacteroidota bacterium]
MKPIASLFSIVCILFSLNSRAQYIQSITMSPSNPTPTDTIFFFAECLFPSGGCDQVMQSVAVSGNNVYASALHCLGPLAVICIYTDTLVVPPLPAGNYTFHFQVDAGIWPAPCTPGIVPGPSDSLNFVVSPTIGMGEYIFQDAIAVFPNPFTDQIQITGIDPSEFPVSLEVYSTQGKLIQSVKVISGEQLVNVKNLPPAVYQLRVIKGDGRNIHIPALKN